MRYQRTQRTQRELNNIRAMRSRTSRTDRELNNIRAMRYQRTQRTRWELNNIRARRYQRTQRTRWELDHQYQNNENTENSPRTSLLNNIRAMRSSRTPIPHRAITDNSTVCKGMCKISTSKSNEELLSLKIIRFPAGTKGWEVFVFTFSHYWSVATMSHSPLARSH